jgi:hypothetical protein
MVGGDAASQGEERGTDVGKADGLTHAAALDPRNTHDPGHEELLLIERPTVTPAPVIQQLLAVVRNDGDHGFAQARIHVRVGDELSEGSVPGADPPVVCTNVVAQLRRPLDPQVIGKGFDLLGAHGPPIGGRRGSKLLRRPRYQKTIGAVHVHVV